MKNETHLRIGLIGLGKMGTNHLRILSILKNIELAFIYDTDESKTKRLSMRYSVKASKDVEKDLDGVDAVVIATPTSTHYDYVVTCSKYVKNIFVEKPLSDTMEDILEIERLALEKGLNIQVGFIERFNPAIIELEKVMDYNSSNIINTDFIRTSKISERITDVDVVLDLMVHDIDLALFLNGDYDKIISYGVEKNSMIVFARATIHHTNGRFSNILASRITEKRIRQINVTAENMYIDCNLLRKEILINKQSVKSSYKNVTLISTEETINVRPQEALLNELLAFIRCCAITKNIPSHIPRIDAAKKSMEVVQVIRDEILRNG